MDRRQQDRSREEGGHESWIEEVTPGMVKRGGANKMKEAEFTELGDCMKERGERMRGVRGV